MPVKPIDNGDHLTFPLASPLGNVFGALRPNVEVQNVVTTLNLVLFTFATEMLTCSFKLENIWVQLLNVSMSTLACCDKASHGCFSFEF